MTTTQRLDETCAQAKSAGPLGIHWVTAGAPAEPVAIERARVVIGRGPGVTVALDAAGVSRQHVEIYRHGPAYIAHDLGSTNGTHVNGRRVEYAPLSAGDVIRAGDVLGVVARVAPDTDAEAALAEALAPHLEFGPALAPQLADLKHVAPTELPVLIVGETGVGKEFIAQAVHLMSGRRGNFHAVNCAALPVALAEAELFGHSRGAFTGAEAATLGHVRAADGGTLFLDELPELPLPVQAKLLRVLQDGRVTPLGDTRAQPVRFRMVAACQEPPERLIASGRLRRDLVERLSGLTTTVPPLRQRRVDIGFFFWRFLNKHAGGHVPEVDPRMLESVLLHAWPGNLRELDLLCHRLLALHGHEPLLRRSFLPDVMIDEQPLGQDLTSESRTADREEHDCQLLARALRQHGGNVTRAAADAGISRARAYRLMRGRSCEAFLSEVHAVGASHRHAAAATG
jgi:transcriptional regulator of acetoin/glycerol metabolism